MQSFLTGFQPASLMVALVVALGLTATCSPNPDARRRALETLRAMFGGRP
ncbi:hypothetical protein [Kitasatospora sp. NE20-6]